MTSFGRLLALTLCATSCVARFAHAEPAQRSTEMSPIRQDENGFRVHAVQSGFQSGTTEIRVLLPDRLDARRRHPCLYVLPVETGNGEHYGNGLLEVKRLGLHDRYQLICVCPTFPHFRGTPIILRTARYAKRATCFKSLFRWLTGLIRRKASRRGDGSWASANPVGGVFTPRCVIRTFLAKRPLGTPRSSSTNRFPTAWGRFSDRRTTSSSIASRPCEKKRTCSGLRTNGSFILVMGTFGSIISRLEKLLVALDVPHVYQDGPKRAHVWGSGWLLDAVEAIAGVAGLSGGLLESKR